MSEQAITSVNAKAAADLSSYQNRFVKISGVKTVNLCTTAGENADGVLENTPDALNAPAKVALDGLKWVMGGAAVTAGDDVTNDSVGRGVTALAGQSVHGRAWTTISAAGEYFLCELKLAGVPLYGVEYHVPSNIATATFVPAVNATWENKDVVALFNAALATGEIAEDQRVRFRAVLRIANTENVAHEVKIGDGECPDGDVCVNTYPVNAAIGNEDYEVDMITDASGQIKIEADDITKVTLALRLKSFSFVHPTAVA
jgi:hypothetical protein